MNQPTTLSTAQRTYGQRRLRRFMALNAIPVSCLMENVLILYAIRNGLSDPLVALMASFVHLSMPFMFFGKNLVRRLGLAKTWGLCWALRYGSVGFIILAPFLPDNGWQVAALLLAGNFGFAAARSMGLIASTPLVGEVTTNRDRGRFIYGNFLRFNTLYILSMVTIVMLLRRWDNVATYQGIIAMGCVVGFIGAYILTTVPESSSPRASAHVPLGSTIRKVLIHPPYRRLLLAWCAGFISFAMVIPFSIMALKAIYGMSDHQAMLYSLLIPVGGLLASFLNGTIADHVGPRPLLILYLGGFFVVTLFWSLAPAEPIPLLLGGMFFVAGFCKLGIFVGLGHYLLALVDEHDRVGSGLLVRTLSGAAAGIGSGLIGASILKLLTSLTESPQMLYQWYFRIAFLSLIPMIVAMYALPRLAEWRIRDILGLFFSPRDLRAMLALNHVPADADASTDLATVQKLGSIASEVSEHTLVEHLQSARFLVRVRALRALAQQRTLGAKASQALLSECREGAFTTAWVAAEILGDHRIVDAIPVLRSALRSDDVFLAGKAMQALAKLGDEESFGSIINMFSCTQNPRMLIEGAHAIALLKNDAHAPTLLDKACAPGLPESVRDEVFCVAGDLVYEGETVYRLLKALHDSVQTFISGIREAIPSIEATPNWQAAFIGDTRDKRFAAMDAIVEMRSSHRQAIYLQAWRDWANACDELTCMKLFMCLTVILHADGHNERFRILPSQEV